MRYVTSHDVAKAFGRFQDEALAEQPITVTRYGRPSVVILSHVAYERLKRQAAERPMPEVYRAGALPDDLLAAVERAAAPAEAAAFDHELDDERVT